MKSISVFFWFSKICWFLVEKCWSQQNSRVVSPDSFFWIFFRYGITVPSLIIVGYLWQILGSVWTTGWTNKKDLKFAIEHSCISTPLNQTNRYPKNRSWKPYWNIRKSSIVWNVADKEILDTADSESGIKWQKQYVTLNRKIWANCPEHFVLPMYCLEILSVNDLVWKENDIMI